MYTYIYIYIYTYVHTHNVLNRQTCSDGPDLSGAAKPMGNLPGWLRIGWLKMCLITFKYIKLP